METKLEALFEKVHAEKELKAKTLLYLRQNIQQGRAEKRRVPTRVAAALAAFTLMIALGGYAFAAYMTPVAYIDMDINPSFELTVNGFGRVICSRAYNADGEKVLGSANIVHKTYKTAVTSLFGIMADNQYIDENELVAITVQASNTDNGRKMVSELSAIVDTMLEAHHVGGSTEIFAVSNEIKTHANRCHMTPAKYLAIERLMELDKNASFDECSTHSVKQLRQYIGEHAGNHRSGHEKSDNCHHSGGASNAKGETPHCGEH